jgi:hypothetical protein
MVFEIERGDVQRISRFFLPNVFCLSADLRISDHIFVFDVDAEPEPDPEPDGCGVVVLSMLPGVDCEMKCRLSKLEFELIVSVRWRRVASKVQQCLYKTFYIFHISTGLTSD